MDYNLNILSKNINDAVLHNNKTGGKTIIRHHIKIRSNHKKYQTYILNMGDITYLKFPGKDIYFMGSGKSIKINIEDENDYNKIIKSLNEYKLFSNIKNDDCICFSVLGFNISKKSDYPWNSISNGEFSIPNIMLYKKNNEHFLVFSEEISKSSKNEKIIENIKKNISKALKQNTVEMKTNISYNNISITQKSKYIKIIDKVIKKIKKTNLEKVIISKMDQYEASNSIKISYIINQMNIKYNDCFNFVYQLNKNNFLIGSSPEKLLKLKNNTIYTEALAGTAESKDNIKNEKEINEHLYVVDYFKNVFKKYCSKISIDKTKPLKLKYAYHLHTKIKGVLNKKTHILSILNNLYPSPALLGHPSKEALKTIEENESFDRGLYGGAIGLFNINGEGDFYVTIRSALINKNNIFLFSGGGITEKSDSLKEWEETELKLEHIKSIIDLK